MEEDKKGQSVPANMEEAVSEFIKAREERIESRRARIAEKVAAAKNAENPNAVDTASIPSSLEFLGGLKSGEENHPDSPQGTKGGTAGSSRGRRKKEKTEKEELKKSQTATDQLDLQVEESRKQLEQLILDGEVLVTNVRVAAEYREKVRQKKHDEDRKERLARLKQEDEECKEMYDELSKNWEMKAEKVLPMELYQQLKAQQAASEELLSKKEEMIILMRREIEEKDFEYDNNLEKYQKDGMLMGDRIDDLVDDLRVAFVEELNLIEDYTSKNRELILEDNQNEWMDLLKDFNEMEEKNLDERKSDAIARFQILNELYIMTKQESRQLRHKMEDDMRILMQEREQVKYACHLNLEKMAYNLHILQCRSKENVQLQNMMKRFLLKLHDKFDNRAASLKRKMEVGRRQIEKMTKEMDRLEMQLATFGQKTLHLAVSDQKKYMDLWEANEDIVREKVESLLKTERFVFETQLGIEFPFPDLKSFDERPLVVNQIIEKKKALNPNHKPSGSDKNATKNDSSQSDGETTVSGTGSPGSTTDTEHEEYIAPPVPEPDTKIACVGNRSLLVMQTDSLEFIPGPEPDPAIQRRLMKSIAKVICDQSGFIVEEELQKTLQPLIKTERNLVTLDAVFRCLGINSVDEMQSLARFMLKYCKTMKGVMSKMNSKESVGVTEMNVSMTGVLGKIAYMEDLTTDSEPSSPSTDITVQSDSEANGCAVDPKKFCDCMSEQLAEEEETLAKSSKSERVKKKKSKYQNKKSVDMDEEEDTNQTDGYKPKYKYTEGTTKCAPVCCDSPADSMEELIDGIDDDDALRQALEDAMEEEEEEEEEEELDCSFTSGQATVLSWLDPEDRHKIVENLIMVKDQQDEEEGDEEVGEETNLEKNAFQDEIYDEQETIPQPILGDEESSEDLGDSDDESKTISIPSYDSSDDASDEFLYIEPEDVVIALKNFIEDYNNKQQVVLPTLEEIIGRKLEKIKYPVHKELADYWDSAIKILNPKGKSTWDTVQHCFEEYHKVLKERNEFVEEIQRLYTQNYELSHLLQKHLQAGARLSPNSFSLGSLDPRNMGYC